MRFGTGLEFWHPKQGAPGFAFNSREKTRQRQAQFLLLPNFPLIPPGRLQAVPTLARNLLLDEAGFAVAIFLAGHAQSWHAASDGALLY